ncbi:uncharacterized protein LOC129269420 isoform X1 [Lytechinus pictus]|uniref:uncharacterized protein LOC129269420 isoform X1 n=2 Tax=Lytechinus pictus TaxID=7653 RepID=UPI0030BA1EA4
MDSSSSDEGINPYLPHYYQPGDQSSSPGQQLEGEWLDAASGPPTNTGAESSVVVQRGRGRGRGPRRGRGLNRVRGRGARSRGRGRGINRDAGAGGSSSGQTRRRRPIARQTGIFGRQVQTHIVERREERLQELRELILNFTLEEIQQLMLSVAERNSGMLLDLMRAPPEQERQPQPPENLLPGWCVCTNCRPMRRDVEMVCCGLQPVNCISLTEHFAAILDPFVVNLQRRGAREAHNLEDDNQAPGAEHNRIRWQVYRSYTLWQHGRLGAGNRVVIPSCVVTRTRSRYPDPNDHYTGFHHAFLCKLK